MNITIDAGYLKISLSDLLEGLPETDRIKLAECVACDDAVIKHVVAQVLEGCTESGYHGSESCTAQPEPLFGLDWARREVARRAGEAATIEIRRLESAVSHYKSKSEELARENFLLIRGLT